ARVAAAPCNHACKKEAAVVALRVLALRPDPAEVVVDVDPANLMNVQLPPVAMTALLADPMGPRALDYTMTACPATDDLRCDDATQPNLVFANDVSGDVDGDPPFGTLQKIGR